MENRELNDNYFKKKVVIDGPITPAPTVVTTTAVATNNNETLPVFTTIKIENETKNFDFITNSTDSFFATNSSNKASTQNSTSAINFIFNFSSKKKKKT